MGKKESKSFRERLGIKNGKSGIKSKDDMKQISVSEMEILSSIYAEKEIKAAERRIDKRIAKRNKEFERKGLRPIQKSPGQERDYQYVRIIPEKGIINEKEMSKEQFYDPNVKGYREKYMMSAYKDKDGNPRRIRVESRGEFTQEEKEEYDRIMRAKKDLENKQRTFGEEEK